MQVERVNAKLREPAHAATVRLRVAAERHSAGAAAERCQEMWDAVHLDTVLRDEQTDRRVEQLQTHLRKASNSYRVPSNAFTSHVTSSPSPYSQVDVTGGADCTTVGSVVVLEFPQVTLIRALQGRSHLLNSLGNLSQYARVRFTSEVFPTTVNTAFTAAIVDGIAVFHSDTIDQDAMFPAPANEDIRRIGVTAMTITPETDASTGKTKMVLRRILLPPCIMNGDLLTAIVCRSLHERRPDVVVNAGAGLYLAQTPAAQRDSDGAAADAPNERRAKRPRAAAPNDVVASSFLRDDQSAQMLLSLHADTRATVATVLPAQKKRKPTHTVRKRSAWPFCVGSSNGDSPIDDVVDDDTQPSNGERQQQRQRQSHARLRDTVHEQQLALAHVRSMQTQLLVRDLAWPIRSFVHLGRDPTQRLKTLHALHRRLVRNARQYVLERTRHLDVTQPHVAYENFVNATGDRCSLRLALCQFPARHSVRDVLLATTFYTANLEISLTDSAGHITIRENEDVGDARVSQHRLLTTTPQGVEVEANVVMFSHWDEADDWGLVIGTFVDVDELYPYRPDERLRHDATAVMMFSRERDECIVMRRWGALRLHYQSPTLRIAPDILDAVRDNVFQWGNALTTSLYERFGR
ncbi:hypothetical protein PINS_up007667 [Pythium insidiosum]|nr:hypothetical protein PINS_up007667 [Pythium insidiosum]